MDATTIIITAIALACFAIPIAIDQRSKKKRNRLEKQLRDAAGKYDLQLDQFETWSTNYAIGLDPSAKKLIYLNTENADNPDQLIDLTDYKGCKSSTVYGAKKSHENKGSDLVRLILLSKNSSSDVELEFFNSNGNRILQNEVQLSEKWAGYIKKSL